MGLGCMNPGGDCCGGTISCTICTGSGCAFTALAGTWSNASGTITTASTNGVYESNNPQPAGTGALAVVASVVLASAGDQGRVLADIKDVNNFLFVQLTAGASGTGLIGLYRRSGGVEALITGSSQSTTATPGQPYVIGICISQDGTTAVNPAGVSQSFKGPQTVNATNPNCGLGTGGTLASTATFSAFQSQRTDEPVSACPDCQFPCITICTSNLQPVEYKVVVPLGIYTANGCTLAQCNAATGTYYVPAISACGYYLCNGNTIAAVIRLGLSIKTVTIGGIPTPVNYQLSVSLASQDDNTAPCYTPNTCGNQNNQWTKLYSLSSPIDCTGLYNEAIPWDAAFSGSEHACTLDHAQNVYVTAV
jgi:hypothetical protein